MNPHLADDDKVARDYDYALWEVHNLGDIEARKERIQRRAAYIYELARALGEVIRCPLLVTGI